MVKCGIVGLPNVGKSTLFNALLKKQVAQSANFPFTTIEPNVGVVEVPDEKLQILAEIVEESSGVKPPIVPAVVEFVDIAGLVKGAHKGEGLGNKFLSHIREVDAIVFVVRDFKNPDIIQTGDNPKDDLEVLKSELLLKDLETVEKRLAVRDPKQDMKVLEVVNKANELIKQGKWIRNEMSDEEIDKIYDLQLLSSKKYIVVINCDETDVAKGTNRPEEIRICARMEEELANLPKEDQKEYLKEVGVKEPGLNLLINKAYEVLGHMSFYTAGAKEVRAWTMKRGDLAPKAAGVIHSDFERGFIAADLVPFEKFVDAGGWKGSRDKGFVRTIGKAEIMPEDVVVEFKFSV